VKVRVLSAKKERKKKRKPLRFEFLDISVFNFNFSISTDQNVQERYYDKCWIFDIVTISVKLVA